MEDKFKQEQEAFFKNQLIKWERRKAIILNDRPPGDLTVHSDADITYTQFDNNGKRIKK